jgi:hypothetical protein
MRHILASVVLIVLLFPALVHAFEKDRYNEVALIFVP